MNAPGFQLWRPHPWHGLSVGPAPPGRVHAYIEICPFDLVKYEVDKETGYLRVDRPQRTSSSPPTLYGFIPRTYCAERVRALMEGAREGDGDPIVAVLENDPFWGDVDELVQLPPALITRLRHYFLTYKLVPGRPNDVSMGDAYDRAHAERVVRAAMADYADAFTIPE
jgi:inorganic pyrophosphatase